MLTGRAHSVFLCVILFALGILFAAWSMASPLAATADEDFHLASIWCSQGVTETCQQITTGEGIRVSVPAAIVGPPCYLENYLESGMDSAGCLETNETDSELVTTHRANQVAGYYPPLFYKTMNMLVGADPTTSVLAMRMLNGILAAIMFGGTVLLTQDWIRRAFVAGIFATLVPLGTFFIPSVNPSSWVIVGVATFWATFLAWLTTPRAWSPRGVALLSLCGFSIVLASTARSDGALFIGVTAAMAILMAWRQLSSHKRRLWILLVPIPALVWSLAFRVNALGGLFGLTFGTQTRDSGLAGLIALVSDLARYSLEIPALFAGTLGANTPQFNQASVFFYGLGTLDIKMPSIVPLLTTAVVSSLIFTSLKVMNTRKVLALTLGAAVFFLVPLLTVSRFAFQYAYSPRYVYPLSIALVSLAFLAKPWRELQLSRSQVAAIAIAFSAANSAALLTTVRRYTNSQKETWLSIFFEPEWWWNFGPSPQTLVLIGSLAGITVASGLALLLYDPRLRSRVD